MPIDINENANIEKKHLQTEQEIQETNRQLLSNKEVISNIEEHDCIQSVNEETLKQREQQLKQQADKQDEEEKDSLNKL